MTDIAADYRNRAANELGRAGNHPDAITAFLDRYETAIAARTLRTAADAHDAQAPPAPPPRHRTAARDRRSADTSRAPCRQ